MDAFLIRTNSAASSTQQVTVRFGHDRTNEIRWEKVKVQMMKDIQEMAKTKLGEYVFHYWNPYEKRKP